MPNWILFSARQPRDETKGINMNGILPALLTAAVFIIAIIIVAASLVRRQRTALAKPSVNTVFTKHAKERMLERSVSFEQLEAVIASPEAERACPKEGSIRLERNIDGRRLRVWVASPWPAAQALVITTAWADPVVTFSIPAYRIGRLIGPGGSTVRRLESENRVRIHVDSTGTVRVTAAERADAVAAQQQILCLVESASSSSHLRAIAA